MSNTMVDIFRFGAHSSLHLDPGSPSAATRTRRRCGVDPTCLRRDRAQIGDESADILRCQILQAVLDGFCHRSGRGTAALRVGRGEKACKLRIRPGANAKAFVGSDVIGAPAFQGIACELAAAFRPKGQIARGVTFATMAERGGQIGAAVNRGRLCGIGCKAPVAQERQIPKRHAPALVERKDEIVLLIRDALLRQAEQIGLDRERIVAAHGRKRRVREGRIKIVPARRDAAMQRTHEVVVAPIAYAGFAIRRDVG
jgi:hypothetical protein